MFNAITRFFESPEDSDKAFISLIRSILIFTILATVVSAIIVAAASPSDGIVLILSALAISGILEVTALAFVLRGKIILAKAVVPVLLVITITIIALVENTIHDIAVVAYPLAIVIATLMQGRRAMIVTTPLAVFGIVLLGVLDLIGLSRSPFSTVTDLTDIIVGATLLFTLSGILNLLVSRLNSAIAAAKENERAQNETNQELRELQISLEERVKERTSELTERSLELEQANTQVQRRAAQFEAVTQVAQAITSIRDLQELLPRVASVISESFGFYHVGVFLLDDVNEFAVLTATNSEGGKKMMARNHRLQVGEQGIVGNVTLTGKARVALDVGEDAVYFDNLELPDTHSEMALPLLNGSQIIGALDVQSTERGAFTSEDVQMLSLLANQVSLAIENARLFDETRRALAESETISRQNIREAWAKLPAEQKLIGFRYTLTGAAPLPSPIELPTFSKGTTKASQTETSQIVVPIELRGEKIASLIVQSPAGIDDDQLDLIRAVAERVAISAENARLFDETTRRAERERTVSEITGKIRSVNDPQVMIQIAIEELQNALGASRVEIVPQTIQGAR